MISTLEMVPEGVVEPKPRNSIIKPYVMSHGTLDNVMPIDETSRKFVPRLRGLGYDVTYREYEGKHVLPPEIRREAYFWWMGRTPA